MNETSTTTRPDEGPPAPPPAGAAWTAEELADPHARADKADRVRSMFAAIARSYDLNNRIHSLGRDQAWRREAVRAASVKPGDEVLDCACGTGDLTLAFTKTPAKSVIGLDFTTEMLEIARQKADRADAARRSPGPMVRYLRGDAQDLPFEDSSFDVLSIAFGIRNVQDPSRALREFFRVLRPGGRLVVLEFDRPRIAPVRWCNDFYCGWVMPRTATLLSHDQSGAYRYLPKSVGAFMTGAQLAEAIERAGFGPVDQRRMTFGVCVRTLATRPG